MLPITGGLYVGWALGSNDAANCFGTAVASRIIGFRQACLLCASGVIVGAILQGEAGIKTLSDLATQTQATLIVVSVAAAITVTIMTFIRLPISTSQAIVGAITGIGLSDGQMNWMILLKVVICWVATPIAAAIFACIVHVCVNAVFRRVPMSILTRDKVLWTGLILVGLYASYALGANNVANVTGIFSGQFPGVSDRQLARLGGLAIALGVLTFSRRVIMAVGKGIMKLDAFSAFVAVSSMALTVHVLAFVGVPVSTSQGIVGGVLGVGLIRGMQGIHFRFLRNIAAGWLVTPAVALVLSAAGYGIFCRPHG